LIFIYNQDNLLILKVFLIFYNIFILFYFCKRLKYSLNQLLIQIQNIAIHFLIFYSHQCSGPAGMVPLGFNSG